MTELKSLCPVCLDLIETKKIKEKDGIYLEKSCIKHGTFRVNIWSDKSNYDKWESYQDKLRSPYKFYNSTNLCPTACGLCENHLQDTCVVIMEVIYECNLQCPVCFAGAVKDRGYRPEITVIKEMFLKIIKNGGPHPVQLSGGEPTLRDDLPEMVKIGSDLGFDHIQINTNGLRIAEDKDYLKRLKENGASLIYLQFDGTDDDIYLKLRGEYLLKNKLKAIENCKEVEIGVLLVPTISRGVNLNQIGDIIKLAKEWVPVVKGVRFQPLSFMGRYIGNGFFSDRVTIPELIREIVSQTDGELMIENFIPTSCEDVHCSFVCFTVLDSSGKLIPTTNFNKLDKVEKGPSNTRRLIKKLWRLNDENIPEMKCECLPGSIAEFVKRANKNYLLISGEAFMDALNFDTDKVKKCCLHIITQDGRFIPFCSYYATDMYGNRINKHKVLG